MSKARKSAKSTHLQNQQNTSVLSAFPKTITPSLGNADPPLQETSEDVSEDIRDTPFPPPLPPASSSSRPDILLKVATPYNADAYDSFFDRYPDLRRRFPTLVHKLKNVFSMGEFPELKETVIWDNSPSVEERMDFVENYFAEEVSAGRMDGPFSRQEVEEILGGPFQCSPISIDVTQKPDGSEKLRLCNNLSKRSKQHPATNDFIDTSKYPTRFDTAAMVADTVSLFYPLFRVFHSFANPCLLFLAILFPTPLYLSIPVIRVIPPCLFLLPPIEAPSSNTLIPDYYMSPGQ